jgi:hypothetical protein
MEKTKQLQDWWVSFESRHLWIARLMVYFTCLAVVVLVCFLLFRYFNLFHTDVGSARYMLSALVQSQAAIVAIVITLTLIAVQLTASAYSPRVIDIFKKNPDMWILLGCYGVSIFYGFLVLKLVEGAEGEFVSQSAIWSLGVVSISFESCVSLAYWLGAFTFVALFPYMWNIISLLKPESIIERLAVVITKDKIINVEEDPIQPIMDIIHGATMKYDLETTRVGLKAVTNQVIGIIDLDGEKEIAEAFCNHLMRVGRLTATKMYEESTIEVIKNFENFGKSTAEKGLGDATRSAVWSLGEVGIAAAEIGLEVATFSAARSLGEVGKAAAEQVLKKATEQATLSLGEVGKAAVEQGLKKATGQAAFSLGEVGKAAAEQVLKKATEQATLLLEKVGKAAAEQGLQDATFSAASSLEKVGKAAAEQVLKKATEQAALSLGEVGIAAAEKGLEVATFSAAGSLGEVGIAAAEKGLEVATLGAALSLEKVGIAAAEPGLGIATSKATWSLGEVGKAAAEQGLDLDLATEQAALSLGKVGKAAAEKELEVATRSAAFSLEKVGIAAAEKGLEVATLDAALSLEKVGIAAVAELEAATQKAKSLGSIGKAAAEVVFGKEFEKVALQVAKSLIAVGRTATEKGLEDATQKSAKSLAELTISSEEIVKTAIKDYESELKKQDRDAFKKFMEIYKQKLERPRDGG